MKAGTLLGFDFGERRIGVAVGEMETGLAHPVATIAEPATAARLAAIERLVSEWKPVALVVGAPQHADGSVHPVAQLAGKFARRLAARFQLPVTVVDETLSSVEAGHRLREGGRREGDVDAEAAAVILQTYLNEPGHGRSPA